MRLAPAFGICWLAVVALTVGYSTWQAVPDARQLLHAGAPLGEQDADTGRAAQAPARSHASRARVAHLRDSDTRAAAEADSYPDSSSIAAEIEREMAGMRSDWESRRRDLAAVRPDVPDLPAADQHASGPGTKDILVTDRMLEVEREYAPRYLNCRIRIRTLEARMVEAKGPVRDSLLTKLERARADLADLDESYLEDLETARHDIGPAIGKDGESSSAQRSTGADSRRDGRAGGGAD